MNEKKYDPYTGYEIHEDQENKQGLNQDSIVIGDAKETYHKEFEYHKNVRCNKCGGEGGTGKHKCTHCNGTGRRHYPEKIY